MTIKFILGLLSILFFNSFSYAEECSPRGFKLLHAAKSGDLATLNRFLNARTINCQDKNGYTALMYAAQYGHVDVVKKLTENGADIEIQNKETIDPPMTLTGATALMLAIGLTNRNSCTRSEVLDILLKAGANANHVASDRYYGGKRPLLNYAVVMTLFHKDITVVNKLILAGSNINSVDGLGNSPLLTVSGSDPKLGEIRQALVDILIEAGANLNISNSEGETLLSTRSFESSNNDLLERFLELGLRNGINAAYVDAAWGGNLDGLKLLLKYGADINARDGAYTACGWAKQKYHHDIVNYLLGLGISDCSPYPLPSGPLPELSNH